MARRTRISIPKAGGLSVFEFRHDELGPPPEGEVEIAVEAAGINYADCVIRRGLYRSAKDYVGWPITPGFEVAGTVAALGPGVEGLEVGQRVLAMTRFGGYANRLHVPWAQVFALPDAMTVEQGATFGTVFLTAWYALYELARPRPGQRVLIHSAAGGVGSAAVQVAKVMATQVTGVVGSSHKVEEVRSLGADHVIDKATEPLWPRAEAIAPDGYDVILDSSGDTLAESYDHLRRPGKLVCYGFTALMPKSGRRIFWPRLAVDYLRIPKFHPMEMTNECKSVLAFNLSYLFGETEVLAEAMADLLGWVAEGRIRPAKVTTYPMEKVGQAHEDLESGATVGKLALTMGPSAA